MSESTNVMPGEAEQPPARPRRVSAAPLDGKRGRRRGAPPPAVVGVGGLAAIILLAGLVSAQRVEAIPDVGHPTRVLVYGLLLIGPAAVAWSLGRVLRLPLFWPGAALAWTALGALLIFVPPAGPGSGPGDYALGLGVLGAALVAAFFPPLFALNARIVPARVARRDVRRPLRQAILLALFIVVALLMLAFGVINWVNLLLLFTVLALAEFFFLSRG